MHRACYEPWEHHDFFESVRLEYRERWERRPEHLRRGAGETKEERARFNLDYEEWEQDAFKDWKEFLSKLNAK